MDISIWIYPCTVLSQTVYTVSLQSHPFLSHPAPDYSILTLSQYYPTPTQHPSPSTTKLSAFVTDHHRSSPGPSPLVTGSSPFVTESPEDAATGRDDAPVAFRMTPAAAVRRRRVTSPERTAARNSAFLLSTSGLRRERQREREGGRDNRRERVQ